MFEKLIKEKKIKIDDNYFKALHAQFDFTKGDSYCENVSGRTLAILRLVGFALCYATIYISRPKRIFSLFKSIIQGKGRKVQEEEIGKLSLRKNI